MRNTMNGSDWINITAILWEQVSVQYEKFLSYESVVSKWKTLLISKAMQCFLFLSKSLILVMHSKMWYLYLRPIDSTCPTVSNFIMSGKLTPRNTNTCSFLVWFKWLFEILKLYKILNDSYFIIIKTNFLRISGLRISRNWESLIYNTGWSAVLIMVINEF